MEGTSLGECDQRTVYFIPNHPDPGRDDTTVERKGPDLTAVEMTVHASEGGKTARHICLTEEDTVDDRGMKPEQPWAGCLSKCSGWLLTEGSFW